jgi:hypothetical protein
VPLLVIAIAIPAGFIALLGDGSDTTTTGAIIVFSAGVLLGMLGLILSDVHQALRARKRRHK